MASKETVLERLNAGKLLIGDGGYITEMERRGYVKAGLWTPEVTVEHPETVECLHKEFARAGSDVLQALTFNGNDKLKMTTAELDEVNESACNIVKKVAKEYGCFWAGGVSSTKIYANGGSKEEVQQCFRAQAEIFERHDADFLIVEYFRVCEEAEWAVETLKKIGKPVMASLCVGPDGDHNGTSIEECAVRLIKAGADVIGVNCLVDPYESLKAVAKMKESVETAGLKTHFMYQPLGFHCPDAHKKFGYVLLPEFPFALEPRQLTRWDVHKLARSAYNMGVRYIGGCCGFKAYHIRAISEEFEMERDKRASNSEKHDPFAKKLFSTDAGRVRDKDYWMRMNPASGRPYCPSYSIPFQN